VRRSRVTGLQSTIFFFLGQARTRFLAQIESMALTASRKGDISLACKKWTSIICWGSAPILAALVFWAAPSPPPTTLASKPANVAGIPSDLVPVTPARFVEVPGIADFRAWSNGATIFYVSGGKIVGAFLVGSANTAAPIPVAGTPLYHSDGSYSGWIIPESARILQAQPSPIAYLPQGLFTVRPDYSAPGVAEDGSYYGEISTVNGLPRTHLVSGYYRNDGTYVRGYYRSR
jgi:hypothetical protein